MSKGTVDLSNTLKGGVFTAAMDGKPVVCINLLDSPAALVDQLIRIKATGGDYECPGCGEIHSAGKEVDNLLERRQEFIAFLTMIHARFGEMLGAATLDVTVRGSWDFPDPPDDAGAGDRPPDDGLEQAVDLGHEVGLEAGRALANARR